MKRPAAWLLLLLLLLGLPLLTGCWDLREMNQLALVVAVGVDKAAEPGRYAVTVQIARPAAAGRGTANQGGGDTAPVYTASADGDTIFAAIRNLAEFTSRRLMWAHNNVVVIGEELARQDITPVMDFFTRNQELRMRTWVVVARGGTARAIVAAKTGIEKVPADSISALFRYAFLPGDSARTDINELSASFYSHDMNPVITAMSLSQRAIPAGDQRGEHGGANQVELNGTAILKDNRVVGFVDRDAGRGLLWLRREMRNAVITIPCPGRPDRNMAAEIRAPKVRYRTDVSGRVPTVDLSVQTGAWLAEQDCNTPKMTREQLVTYTDKAMAQKIGAEIRQALTAVQGEMQTDVLFFGRHIHMEHPAWWRANSRRWTELFPRAIVNTHVQVHITKMGLFARPMADGMTR